jgi:hypothetical protein
MAPSTKAEETSISSATATAATTPSTSSCSLSSTNTNNYQQFKVGDHVFKWCSYMGVPFSYQEHGIVVALNTTMNANANDDDEVVILNIDQPDENFNKNNDGNNREDRRCCMTVQRLPRKEAVSTWEHVHYNQQQWHICLSQRAGTCTPESPDPTPVVLFRIQFLRENPTLLSSLVYDSHKRNGECLVTWCQTGQYKSAQGSAKMGEAGLNIGPCTLAGGIAAQLAASAVVPVLLPFMAAMDVGQAVVQ